VGGGLIGAPVFSAEEGRQRFLRTQSNADAAAVCLTCPRFRGPRRPLRWGFFQVQRSETGTVSLKEGLNVLINPPTDRIAIFPR
jgi:hypothetical protein